jgi:hypothetical protein
VTGRPGRPPLDPRIRAEVYRLHAADSSLGARAIAKRVGVSRETVRKLLMKSAQSPALDQIRKARGFASTAYPGWLVVDALPGVPAGSEPGVAPMTHPGPLTEADHDEWELRPPRVGVWVHG